MRILVTLLILTALSLSAVAQSGQKMVAQSTDGDRPYSFDSLLLAKAKITSPDLLNDIGFVRYTALLMRTLDGDTTVDFSRMRFWFTQTKRYDPFALAGASKLAGFRDSMYLAYTAKNWRTVRDFAGKILQREFCDIDAQSLASTSNLQLGDTILAKVQGWTAHKLLESIKSSGDGLSPQTASNGASPSWKRPPRVPSSAPHMGLAVVHSRALAGFEAPPVTVEVHLAGGLPSFTIVGLPDTEVKESRDRVRAAIQTSRFEFPARRITVNLAPAELPKEGGRFDLPIALGILAASGQVKHERLGEYEFAGEQSR